MSESEGDKLWKSAKKLTSPSLMSFRMKSDWEQAGPLYEKAALCFRQAKAWDKARDAYEMAAKCSQRQDSPWHAAKHLEKASEAAKETQDWTLVVDYLKQASLAYREAGRTQSAAEALSKGARFLEERDPQAAAELLAEAVVEVESDGRLSQAGDLFRQAIGLYIRTQKYPEAVGMLLRFAAACDTIGAAVSQCKAYLGAVVVWLFAGNGHQAWAVYQDALEVDAFAQSDEAFAAEALFEAYKTGTAEDVKSCIAKKNIFFDLDNNVARCAKKLPNGPLQSIAAALGGPTDVSAAVKVSAEDLDEDNLT